MGQHNGDVRVKEFFFQKLDGKLKLLNRHDFEAWAETLEDKACYFARFTEAASSKTCEQLGWLFAGIIPDVIQGLSDLGWNECGSKEFLGTRIALELNAENVDDMLKTIYAISRGVPVPSKARMSAATFSDFIEVILLWAADNGISISPPRGSY